MEACLQLKELTRSRISNWLECMKVMLNQEGVNIRDLRDNESNTPLHYAAKSGYIELVNLFLNKDCYLGHMNKFNIPPLAYISEDTLKNYFDKCSQMTDKRTNKCTIEFNYRCLKPYNVSPTNSYDLMKNREMQLFEYLVHSKTYKEIIKHPLLSSFLYLKWHRIQHFLLANFVLYMVFYFILISYILIMGLNSSVNKNGTQLTKNVNSNNTNLNTYQNYPLCPIIFIWLIFLIFGEILQFVCNCRFYIKDWMNVLQIVLYGFTAAFLCSPGIETGIAVTLLSIWKITIMISQYLKFSIGIVLFRTVVYNFVCLFSPYIFFIVMFSMLFHILYGESYLSPNPVFAYIKTIITLVNNLSVISDNIISDSRYSTWFSLVLVILVILMIIILRNILNSLALIDLVDIRSQAELIELSYRIQLIVNFENFACMIGRLMNRYFLKNSSQVFNSFVNRIFLFCNYLKDDKITFWIHDTEKFDEESGHSEVISLFRIQDCYISHNKFNVLPVAYNPKGMLATYFNCCVKKRAARQDVLPKGYHVHANCSGPLTSLSYNSYRDDSDYSDDYNDILEYHEWHKRVKLSLRHGVSPIRHFKLREIRHEQCNAHWFMNFVLYMVFYLILNSYVLIMRYNSSSIKNKTQLANNITFNNTTDELNSPTQVQNNLRISIAILLLFLIFRDVFRFVRKPRRYIKNWMNGLQIMLFELTIALLCDGKIHTGIVVILLATWKFMIIISKYPRKHLFTCNVIFGTVLHNLRLYLSLFSPYIFPIAFSMTFYIFYKKSDSKVFSHPTYAAIKIIIMLTGDFVIDKTTSDLCYMRSYLVFVILVLLIVIVLVNNLNDLKVSDILREIEQIKLNELIYRIQLIAYFENIIYMISGLINHYFFQNLL